MDQLAERLKNMTPLQKAVLALRETQARLDALEQQRAEPIAIVGMGCRFPGGANDPASFWRMLCEGRDAVGEIPPDRWDVDAFYDPDPTAPGKMCTRWGGFLERIDEFDNHFFGISDREAARVDPQQRMLLEVAWEALEDAGIPPDTLRGGRVGVFVGISTSEYGMMLSSDPSQTDAYVAAGTSLCIAANRLSYVFGFQGPSLALDTACSSSLVAVHLACQHIRNGECEAALVGGSNLLLSPTGTINLTKAGFCAPDGRVRAFDDKAAGYVRSEGVGVVVLKPLRAALKHNDPIYAVIRGSAVNQNGSSNGLTAPSRAAQEQVLREAYARANVSPGHVQFVEAQGTGTRLGDTIEATALGSVLREGRTADDRCVLGALKTNLGHLEAASGIASLMKTALALKHQKMPPNLHFQTPNPDIPFDSMPLRVPRVLESWPNGEHPRLAGVNAFGFGGSNSHIVLEESPLLPSPFGKEPSDSLPSPFGRGAGGEGVDGKDFDISVRSSQVNSPHPNPLPKGEGTDSGPPPKGEGTIPSSPKGEGTKHLLPLSARTETALDDLARRYGEFLVDDPPSWSDVCYTAAARREHHDCRLAVLADSQEDAADRLQSFLAKPQAACDHLFVGRKPYGRALKIAFFYDDQIEHWKPLVRQLIEKVPGFTAALEKMAGRSAADILHEKENDRNTLLTLQLAMTAWWRGLGIMPDVVFGKGVGELAAAYAAGILAADEVLHIAANDGKQNGGTPKSRPAALPMLSAVDGKSHAGPDLTATHWQACLRGDSHGFDAAINALQNRNIDVCLEIGPKTLCVQPFSCVPSLLESAEGHVDVLTAVGKLYAAGADVRWQRLSPVGSRPVHVPTYPWQRQKLWAPIRKQPATVAPKKKSPEINAESIVTEAIRRRADLTTPYAAPRTPLETTLAESWASMLRIDRVGIHDNFFELGGDSLQAAILLNQVASKLGRPVSVPLRDLFHTPTIAALAGRVEEALSSEAVDSQPALIPIPRDGELPLSFNQEALWFLDRLEPNRPTYMLHLALNVRGSLDIPALERALNEIVRRHESLRTTFPEVNDRPVQVIAPPKPQSLPVIDLTQVPESDRETLLRRRIAEEMNQPIDLQNGPLIRILLLRRAENDYAVVASTHHIIHDGWSMGILLGELAALYVAYTTGGESPLPELPIQYVDFSAWQRKLLQGETLERLRTFWREQLSGVPPLELPTDHPRPAIRTTRGSSRPCRLSRETSDAVLEFCRREGVTPFMVLLAAFKVLLMRYAGQTDFAVGVPVANRNRPETESLIGYFVNVVVLRSELSGEISFREAIDRVRKTALDAFERQEMTLDQVVDAVAPARDPSRNPLFQVMFALQNIRLPSPPKLDLTIAPLDDSPAPPSANFDLTLELFERDEGFSGGMSFCTDLFDPSTVDRMIEQYQVLVAAAVESPDQNVASLPLLEEEQAQEMIDRWNQTARDYDRTRLVRHLVEAHAARQPDATAVVLDDRRWTYGELNRRANQFAHYLRRLGVGPETRVGICLERSPELIAAVLGVMKAGGAYVPLDPAYTSDAEERVKYILQDAKVSWMVTKTALAASLEGYEVPRVVLDGDATETIAAESSSNLDDNVQADNLAYILYTSGSTGRPKGVMVTQGNLLNAYYGWENDYRLDCEVHSHLQMASFSFDVFEGDLVRALCSGGKLVICRKDVLLDPKELLAMIEREKVDIAEFVPVILRTLIQHLEDADRTLDSMRMVIAGSDAWYAADHHRARTVFGPRTRLVNSYGLTETTIDSCYFEGEVESAAATGLVPIGRPFSNVRLYVLDDGRRPTPIGVPGELYIGGDGVSRGYVNTDLNAARFPEDPFAVVPGARMCRTGDRARRRADGQIEFIGRADNQVKIRGFRIEPSEVEQVLREYPLLAEAAVVARQRTPGDMRLAAYTVAKEGESPVPAEMRRFLRERLPEYMIPSAFVALPAMPVTSSGKTDRRALPDPDWNALAGEGEFVVPRTPIEQQLASIWSELLGVDRVGVSDSFFDLGGNSLLVLRLVSRIRSAFSIELPLVAAFTSPTLGELAEQIQTRQAGGCLPDLPPIERIPRDRPLLASFGQERFWFLQQLSPYSAILNMHDALPVTGELDVDALRRTVNEIVRRHEVMRTTFAMSEAGDLVQVVAPESHLEIPVEDLGHLSEAQRPREVERLSQEEAGKPFDLTAEPPFRVRILRLGDREHVLLVTTHHIAHDGWSADVLVQEVVQIYDAFRAGRPSPLPELPVQYADYAVWQRNWLQGERVESLLSYWRDKLRGLEPLKLPTDQPRRTEAHRVEREHNFQVSNRLKTRLQRLCSEESATPFMLCLAAFQTLLHRYSDTDDIAVATPVANRLRPETQRMLGLFINTLVLRSDLSSDPSFRGLLAAVRQTAIEAYDRQELPFERLVADLHPQRDLNIHPLAQVMLSFNQRTTTQRIEQRQELKVGFQNTNVTLEADEMFDLTLVLTDIDQGLYGQLTYDNGLFDDETIERMAEHFLVLLEAVVENPDQRLSQVPLLAEHERRQVLVDWNQTEVDYADAACVQQLFETQARRAPDAVALVFEGETTSYGQLNARANQLAHYLLRLGVVPETPVGICLEPTPEMIVAILAVLKAGGAYVPLDPDDPRERLDFIVADSRPAVVLTTTELTDKISAPDAQLVRLDADRNAISRESEADPECQIGPDNAICILYTSGSTGNPKGAVNLHRGVRNYLLWKRHFLQLGPDDRILFATPLSFDVSVEEVFDPLVCGGRMVIAAADKKRDPSYLVQLMADQSVTTACFVPSILRVLLEDEHIGQCRALRSVLSGGESLHPDLMERFFQRLNAELYNIYGPTEASMGVTVWKCRSDYQRGVIPIGQPISNVRLYILDGQRNPVPVGVAGELYIGGIAVARGYLNRPDLNAEAFLPDPFGDPANDRLYRTGDRCRWLPDGNVEFLGRWDGQVKISGTRIELGEVEAAVNRHPAVAQAAVVTRESAPGHKYLAAYVVPRNHRADDEDARDELIHDLRRFLKSFLPDYIIPQAFEIMDVLPQLPSGKVNRAALPAVAPATAAARRYVAPRTPIEQQLAAICAEVLKRDRVGLHDNFFELGGHSLLAVQLMVRVRAAFSIDLPVAALFTSPTVAELTDRIEAAQRGEMGDDSSETEEETMPERRIVDQLAANLLTPSTENRPQRGNGQSLAPLRSGGSATPLFCIHGLGGHIAGFLPLANGLAEGRPVYGLQAQGLEPGQQPHDRIETMAEFYLNEIREVQPRGPYWLVGWSLGGLIALEAAQRIQADGEEVSLVAMLDTYLSLARFQFLAARLDDRSVIRWLAPQLDLPVKELKKLPLDQQWQRIAEAANLSEGVGVLEIRRLAEVCKAHLAAAARYRPQPYQGAAVLFQADMGRNGLDRRWKKLCPRLRVEQVPGDHYDMLRKPHVDQLAKQLDQYLTDAVDAYEMAGDR